MEIFFNVFQIKYILKLYAHYRVSHFYGAILGETFPMPHCFSYDYSRTVLQIADVIVIEYIV